MASSHYVVVSVECPRCKTRQKLHVAAWTESARLESDRVPCINCGEHFKVMLPEKIVAGPFPA